MLELCPPPPPPLPPPPSACMSTTGVGLLTTTAKFGVRPSPTRKEGVRQAVSGDEELLADATGGQEVSGGGSS